MRIVQIVPYYPPHIGGVENVAKELSERLAARGDKVEVFTSDRGGRSGRLKNKENLTLNYLPSIEFAHSPIAPLLFFKLLKISPDSIMHVHLSHAFFPEIVYLISKIKKIPYIAQLHSDTKSSSKMGIFLPFYKRVFLEKILSNAQYIICLSEVYRQIIEEKYRIDREKILVIPNGVSEEFFRAKEELPGEYFNLLYVGRLCRYKNILVLIEAFSLIKEKAVLHIVGEGELREEIIKMVKEQKLENIILHGAKFGQELLDIYRKADIFILPSTQEGFPLVLLEALASGIPIIVSDIPELRGLFEKVSVLVDPPTPKNFAREIEELLNNQEKRAALVKKGLEKAHDFHWDKIVDKYREVYEKVGNIK